MEGLTTLMLNLTKYSHQHPDLETQNQLIELRHIIMAEVIQRTGENARVWIAKRNRDVHDAHS